MFGKRLFEFSLKLKFDKATDRYTAEEFYLVYSTVPQRSPSSANAKMCMSGTTPRNCVSPSMYRT